MSTTSACNLKFRKILFASLLAIICILLVFTTYQQNKKWVVPEEVKKLKNPVTPSESTLKAASGIYMEDCAQCHGEHGKGDGPEARMHFPAPADLSDASQMAAVTDGEIFYQISEGRRPMPSFKKRLTQDQRWELVLLVRSFSAPSAPAIHEEKPAAVQNPTASPKN
jgi:mono/diheme cytochrome c family protein